MPANRVNYIVLYKNESQVFGSASKEVALKTPPPENTPLEDKRIFFITYKPDEEVLSVHQVPRDQVLNGLEDEDE